MLHEVTVNPTWPWQKLKVTNVFQPESTWKMILGFIFITEVNIKLVMTKLH